MPDPVNKEFTHFQELAQELKDQNLDSLEYQFFISAVTAAEEKMAALHRTKRNRLAPVLTSADRHELMNLLARIGQAAELLIKSDVPEDLKEQTRRLTAIAAGNYRTIKAYDPAKESKSLPELLEDARAVTLRTQGVKMEEGMRGNQSERRPLAYINEKGKKIAGVFTAKTTASYVADVEKIFEEEARDPANRMSPEAQAMMRGFITGALPVAHQIGQQNRGETIRLSQTRERNLMILLWGISFGSKIYSEYLENALRKVYPQLQGQNLDRVFGKGTIQRICRKLDPLANTIGIQVNSAYIPEGARLDTRNAAMYGAAGLLGVSHLVAKAVPMKLIGPNGEVTEGTFMHKAKGMDIMNLPPSALNITEDALNGTDGKGYKDLADLQVVDYLCGNVDRHGANMFYRFRNGKFCGVQAIDNDSALGNLWPKGIKNINRLVVPKNMKVISRSMFEKVLSLTPAEWKFSLRGYGLSESELTNAGNRLETLQEELKKGTVKVMEDEDFRKLNVQNIGSICVKDPQTHDSLNVFALARNMIRRMPSFLLEQTKRYRDLEDMAAIGEDNRALPGSQEREKKNADVLMQEMKRVTVHGFWHFHKGTSQEFEDMREAVRKYGECQMRVWDKIQAAKAPGRANDPDMPIDSIVSREELEEMASLSKIMKEKANAYLEKKAGSRFNSYTNARKQIARLVRDYGEAREELKDIELQTHEKQEALAVRQSKRIFEKLKQAPAGLQL